MGNGAKNFFDVGLNSDFTPLMVLDSNYDIKRLNIAAKKFLNNLSRTKNQNFMGKSILNLIPELAENNRIADGVFEVNIDDKLYYLFPFRIDRENIDESIGILVIDVYSNKEQESELAYQKEITADFEEIFEGSFDGILVTDKDGKVLYVNSSYERVAEIKKSDLEGKYMVFYRIAASTSVNASRRNRKSVNWTETS
jgi:PAS domain S-box